MPGGLILCLGEQQNTALTQAACALAQGNPVIIIMQQTPEQIDLSQLMARAAELEIPLQWVGGQLQASDLTVLKGFAGIATDADAQTMRSYRIALAARDGALLPLINEASPERYILERHLCVDTTAAGGNASLIAAVED